MGGLLDPLTSICLTTPSCLPNDLALVFTRLRRRGRVFLCSSDGRSPSTSSSISSILLSNSSSSSLVVRGSHLSVSTSSIFFAPSSSSSFSSFSPFASRPASSGFFLISSSFSCSAGAFIRPSSRLFFPSVSLPASPRGDFHKRVGGLSNQYFISSIVK